MIQGLDNYKFINKPIDAENLCIKNGFTTSMVQNLNFAFGHNRIPTFNIDELPIKADFSQLINILDLPALTPNNVIATVYDETSYAMYDLIKEIVAEGLEFWQAHKRILTIDYLLTTSICLVEQYGVLGEPIQKFYATRNPYLITEFTGDDRKLSKYLEHIKYTRFVYESGALPVVKLSSKNDEIKASIPRTPVNFNKVTKITPFFITRGTLDFLDDELDKGIYKVKYIKDNMTVRELVTTKQQGVLSKFYPSELTARMYLNQTSNLLRGYIHTPELGISQYDTSGTRALNISRIIEMKKVPLEDVDTRYIDVFFDNIAPTFRASIRNCYDLDLLQQIYYDFTHQQISPNVAVINNCQELLVSFIDTQVTVGTTTALKRLHTYMLTKPEVFKGYTGKKPVGFIRNSGMMGVVEG